LLTDGIPGMSSETESCHDDKARLVEMLASVLIDLHVLPIDDCPIDRGPEQLLARGRKRVETGIVTQQMVDDQGLSGSPSEALQELVHRMPSTSKLVFTHGDYCLPNVMIQEGRVSGLIDLGYAGISDAYRDFVAADYSIARNL
ncbi:MAG TPA: APH(3') family aminoglycoside O-phosphotransferase, partial [Candidatus Latescibacteria bacterium]|nr:APH(3') family aminoglycoside O-phosphotransferase [Candidatus Latescibacterota bacterium]